MHVHWVLVTKYRREVFTKEILDDLRPIFANVCTDFGAELKSNDSRRNSAALTRKNKDDYAIHAVHLRPKGQDFMRT